MKRIVYALIIVTIIGIQLEVRANNKQRELYIEAPVTDDTMTPNEKEVIKFKDSEYFELVKSSSIADGAPNNSYIATYFDPYDKIGSSVLGDYTFYSLMIDGDDFIVLNKYYTNGLIYERNRRIEYCNFKDSLDASWYTRNGYRKPIALLQAGSYYGVGVGGGNTYGERNDWFILDEDGLLHVLRGDMRRNMLASVRRIRNGIWDELDGSGTDVRLQYLDRGGAGAGYGQDWTDAYKIFDIAIENGSMRNINSRYVKRDHIRYDVPDSWLHWSLYEGGSRSNGKHHVGQIESVQKADKNMIPGLSNKFPDGRYVNGTWTSVGGNLYEVWYNVYESGGDRIATGPTAYSGSFANSFSTFTLGANTIGNSKFTLMDKDGSTGWSRDYFRIAVVNEDIFGEIQYDNSGMGNKDISPKVDTDTQPIKRNVDFSLDELDLGYNIVDGRVTDKKISDDLNRKINSIDLGLITVKKGGGNQVIEVELGDGVNFDNTIIQFSNQYSIVEKVNNGAKISVPARMVDNMRTGEQPMVGRTSVELEDGSKVDNVPITMVLNVIEKPKATGNTSIKFD